MAKSYLFLSPQVIMRNDMGVQFGYKTVEWVLDSFYSLHLSIQSLQRELTVCAPGLALTFGATDRVRPRVVLL